VTLAPKDLRDEIEALYGRYVDLLDEDGLEEWPALFMPDALYKIVSRENETRGWPLATMSCDGRAAIEDRIYAIRNTSLYVPRSLRHLISHLQLSANEEESGWCVSANYAVFETLPEQSTRVFSVGRYRDLVVRDATGELRFAEKICVYDSTLIPNSLILPL
jgi:3-phenylpropionate/cinnamic acid dioxygenase small subunit